LERCAESPFYIIHESRVGGRRPNYFRTFCVVDYQDEYSFSGQLVKKVQEKNKYEKIGAIGYAAL
jgi:hypothetical protein